MKKALRAVEIYLQGSIVIDWLLYVIMVVMMVVNLEFRFILLVFVKSDDFTKAEERDQTKDNVGKHGSGRAIH